MVPDAALGRCSRYGASMGTETEAATLAATFVGHSTVLIEVDGARILTDPLLRLRVGVLIRHSPVPPAAVYRDLDAVVVSHAHIDHLDVPSLRLIDKDTPVLAPRATKRLIKRLGFADVTEMEPGESRTVGRVRLTATPADHGITRHPMAAPGNSLGYLVEGRLTAYFAGDTGLFDEMAGLADDLALALLPVGGWGPRLPEDHLNPLTAAKALRLLRPAVAVPIHWGTLYPPWLPPAFNAKFGAWPAAFTRYAAHLAPGVDVRVLQPGETTRIAAAGD
jgi:L-ascorbate metabolism protein UlaG (beta-lactamase superfamily)